MKVSEKKGIDYIISSLDRIEQTKNRRSLFKESLPYISPVIFALGSFLFYVNAEIAKQKIIVDNLTGEIRRLEEELKQVEHEQDILRDYIRDNNMQNILRGLK